MQRKIARSNQYGGSDNDDYLAESDVHRNICNGRCYIWKKNKAV